MRFARRTFRPSVVRVVAAFAPLAGCSELHGPETGPAINPPAGECDPGTPGCAPEVREPAAPPSDAGMDARATPDRPDSGDPGTPTGVVSTNAQLPMDANLLIPTCPAQEPSADAACLASPSAGCSYGASCGARHATCYDSHWRIFVSTCNPPFVPCPDAAPVEDSGCGGGLSLPRCTYGSCDGGAALSFECRNAAWYVAERCGRPTCPQQRPPQGSDCRYEGPECAYDHCYDEGTPRSFAQCVQGSWSVRQPTLQCAPPAPCPALAPVQGSPCTRPRVLPCTFSLSVGGEVVGVCVDGAWQLRRLDAGI